MANQALNTPGDDPAISPEMLLLSAIYLALGEKTKARASEIIEREATSLKVMRLRGPRPAPTTLDAYHAARGILQRLEAL